MDGLGEFLVSRRARERFRVRDSLRAPAGPEKNDAFHGLRIFAQRLAEGEDRPPARAGELNALGLIHAIFHRVIEAYRETRHPSLLEDLDALLADVLGPGGRDGLLKAFLHAFPPGPLYREEAGPEAFLLGTEADVPARVRLVPEILVLWVANRNPAASPFADLLDEGHLEAPGDWARALEAVVGYFGARPGFGPDGEDLLAMLQSPARAVPGSLQGQLEFILQRWRRWLGDWLSGLLLRGLDLLREEAIQAALPGKGESAVYDFTPLDDEPEAYTPDRDWMPNLVLLAKNAHVWLGQLGKSYGRDVRRLDQIPDEELDRLARWGFTGLWLIGIWERSPASSTVKRIAGNPEALASAYAVSSYTVAEDLGGEEAFAALKDRARVRGIRMATDMVPNHMGLDSPWVVDHPDRFLSLAESPYPWYRFDSPNVSSRGEVSLHLEAHYYDRTDAAVVFRRTDHRSGEERFVYHGNDGTRMPWNDTAQLDYLNPETREAVIREILAVARKSPIIRFDAAMTLTRRHFQRLWFPEPGTGGAIPTRAEAGLSRDAFLARMPEEFWREVVDRVQAEEPDTLLLAEAFWLMEGFFVRTLGMHRVYNSAFMNMLKDEENGKYRSVLKNTLEFDPEVLQRFVNFLSNPDEETALDQFGKDDKYFGVCTLAATLPGLPMFAHGQVEGLSEKYGMEYARAYREEGPDAGFLAYHEQTVFPLLRRRALFAGAAAFRLYDFFCATGVVNEDVFAYSNRKGPERVLVVYNNRDAHTAGWIRTSTAFRDRNAPGPVQCTLGEGLGIAKGPGRFVQFRDHVTGRWYLREAEVLCEEGLYAALEPYQRHVFLDFTEVRHAPEAPWAELARVLDGRGVEDLHEAMQALRLQKIRDAFALLAAPESLGALADASAREPEDLVRAAETLAPLVEAFTSDIGRFLGRSGDARNTGRVFALRIAARLGVPREEGAPETETAVEAPREVPVSTATPEDTVSPVETAGPAERPVAFVLALAEALSADGWPFTGVREVVERLGSWGLWEAFEGAAWPRVDGGERPSLAEIVFSRLDDVEGSGGKPSF